MSVAAALEQERCFEDAEIVEVEVGRGSMKLDFQKYIAGVAVLTALLESQLKAREVHTEAELLAQ